MEYKELQVKNEEELKKMLAFSRENLREMRFKVAQRQLKKVRDIRNVKREIAMILTLLKREKNK